MSLHFNKRRSSPFGQGNNWSLNACVGTNGGPYDYSAYASGYFEAGNSLARQIIDSHGRPPGPTIDIAIYPLLYLYRQGAELMMKHFIFDKLNAPKNDREHDLKKLWSRCKTEMEGFFGAVYRGKELSEPIEKLESFILKMHELDPRGEVTRFPEDPKGNLFLQEYSVINVEPIYQAANEVLQIFESFLDARNEMSEYGSDDL